MYDRDIKSKVLSMLTYLSFEFDKIAANYICEIFVYNMGVVL